MTRTWTRPIRIALALVAALAAATVVACGSDDDSSSGGGGGGEKLSLVAYSTPQEAYEEIIPAFEKTADGKGVTFNQSYAASGEQSRAVEGGLPADIVAFSLAPDVDRLVDAGLVAEDWANTQNDGFVTNSVVVFVVRKGNPENIETWDDLTKDGVEVITPNPYTSGGAKWNIMAAWGAQLEQGKSEDEAKDYLSTLFDHVPVLDKSAREALQTFAGGKGDVLISYENEAITAQQKGEDVDYVIPDETLLIQNPAAVTTDAPATAQKFLDFLHGDEAQKIYQSKGYRTVNPDLADDAKFPVPPKLFEITKFGGWDKVNADFFDPEGAIVTDIFQDQGKSTASG
ncbi:MAG: sulfate ABC transporter substrate-binding protein [Thermoleophilaceae bacterium]|nr:sulfate ABC transporter substrate-binding protein [Thermoleophilaceae bacterium]